MRDRLPVNPMPLPDSPRHERIGGRRVEVSDSLVARLRDVCGTVSVDGALLDEASRDWWPLAMVWARHGGIPARPGVVARPAGANEVAAVLAACNDARVPVTASAGRSGVCGAAIPVFGGVVLDVTGLSGITGVDDDSLLVDVLPGTWGDDFEAGLRDHHGLTLGHWPQSIELSTVGGWIACRSAGQYSTRYGKIEDMVVGLDVALANGSIIHTGGDAPRSATGPDLNQLFVGSEGTLGVITAARLRARPIPTGAAQAAYSFSTFALGLDACRRILRAGATPAVLRLYDERESRRSFDVVDANALIVLDEADPAMVQVTMDIVERECRDLGAQQLDPALVDRWLSHRNDVSGLADAINRDVVVDTCEIAGRWSALPDLYERAVAAVKAIDGAWVCSAHQSHAYADGACLYFTFAGQRDDDPEGFYVDVWDAITNATRAAGCAISHHHGVGINRARFMDGALGSGSGVLAAVKDALDPNGILNPGKLGLPSPFGAAVPWPGGNQ